MTAQMDFPLGNSPSNDKDFGIESFGFHFIFELCHLTFKPDSWFKD